RLVRCSYRTPDSPRSRSMIIVDGSSGAARRVYPPCGVRYSSPQSTAAACARFTASRTDSSSVSPHNRGADLGAQNAKSNPGPPRLPGARPSLEPLGATAELTHRRTNSPSTTSPDSAPTAVETSATAPADSPAIHALAGWRPSSE